MPIPRPRRCTPRSAGSSRSRSSSPARPVGSNGPSAASSYTRHSAAMSAPSADLGPFRGLPATGRAFEVRCVAVFEFDDGDGIVCERPYFDSATILRQLGIAHDPLTLRGRLATLANHPVTIGTAAAKDLLRR